MNPKTGPDKFPDFAISLESAQIGQTVLVQSYGRQCLGEIEYADDERLWIKGEGYWRRNGEKVFLPQHGWSRYPHLEIVQPQLHSNSCDTSPSTPRRTAQENDVIRMGGL